MCTPLRPLHSTWRLKAAQPSLSAVRKFQAILTHAHMHTQAWLPLWAMNDPAPSPPPCPIPPAQQPSAWQSKHGRMRVAGPAAAAGDLCQRAQAQGQHCTLYCSRPQHIGRRRPNPWGARGAAAALPHGTAAGGA